MLRLREPDVSDAELVRGLRHKSGPVVTAAARMLKESPREVLRTELVRAFHRLCKAPYKRDPGATAKTWIAKALVDDRDDEVLLAGARFVQLDPAWGPPEDVSTELRGLCTLDLVARGRRIEAERVSAWLKLRVRPERRRVGMVALALLRTDEGREALEHIAQWGSPQDQTLAAEALDI
ncbi:MAG: hypothetical protein GY913_29265 [Proteobacteria bacterium]|nr:hypothetical protein [Pseudomonadota bacterium]